jgi:hypothetical protein
MSHTKQRIAIACVTTLSLAALAFAPSAQAANAPVLTIEEASSVTAFGATLSGTVDPGGATTGCSFEFVPDAQFQSSGFQHLYPNYKISCNPNPVTGAGAQSVNAQLTGLRPNTVYHYRLVAGNEAGTAVLEGPHTFTTLTAPPQVATGPNTPFPEGKVHLLGYVDPEGSPVTSCKFVYGTEAGSYDSEAPCANHPGDEIQALSVGATAGRFRLDKLEHNGTTGTGDLTAGSNIVTNVTISTGEFVVGQPLRTEDDDSYFGTHRPSIKAVGSGTLELDVPAASTAAGVALLSERVEATADLPFDAAPAEVQNALEATPAIGPAAVAVEQTVDTSDYRRYLITFEGPLANTDVDPLAPVNGGAPLSDASGKPYMAVKTLNDGGLAEPHEVIADLSGLSSGVTYHYRLLAGTGAGTGESEDAVFRPSSEPPAAACPNQGSPGVGFLPECRAWEMVSPPGKNGGDVASLGETARVAADGSAATFVSPSAFGDASGTGTASEYESVRAPGGWQTHGILPPGPALAFFADVAGLETHYQGDFSSDLNRGVVAAFRPLDDSDPNVDEAVNLYLRTDLRSPGPGSYTLLTHCPLCAEENRAPEALSGGLAPHVIGASSDFHHVVFESPLNLVKPAHSPDVKLYESEEGAVRLLGILPNGSAAFESTAAGFHYPAEIFPNRNHAVSSDGSKVVFIAGANIYLRLDHEATVQLNESELSPSKGNGTAHFQDASLDGARVFFTDSARLSENAPEGGGLYVYDTTKPPSDPSNLTFVAPATGAFGASAAGDTVYFWLGNISERASLYVWRDGEVRPIGFISSQDSAYVGPHVSADGQLLFHSIGPPNALQSQFPGYCPGGGENHPICGQLYTYDPATEALQCASCAPAGEPSQNAMQVIDSRLGAEAGNQDRVSRNPLSSDGRHVFFATNVPLVPEDTNGVFDVYAFDTETSQVGLISRGTDPYPSYFMEATPDGSNIFFTTRQHLSGWDIDGSVDLYDARVAGGLPEPVPVPAGCGSGETCPLPPVPPPPREANGSESLEGSGNPQRTCPRGTRLVHSGGATHCAKPRHRRRHHHKRGGRK